MTNEAVSHTRSESTQPLPAGRRHHIVVAGGSATYGETGSGPPLLFLHGWGLDDRAYGPALQALATHGVHVIAPALPGFGGTSALGRDQRSFAGYAAWVAEFLAAIDVDEPVVVVGHSFGGGVAITLAHDHPATTRGLVLVNSVGGSAWRKRGSVIRAMTERPLWDWGLHLGRDLLPVRQLTRVLPVIVSEAIPSLLRDPKAFWRAATIARAADLTDELEALRERGLPIVVLWGTGDGVITEAAADALCEASGTDCVIVPGGHSWMITEPTRFGEVMTNVLPVARGRTRRRRWGFGRVA